MKSATATIWLMTIGVFCLLQWSSVSGCTERDRLVRDITQGYVKSVEPDNIVLKVQFSILCARIDKVTGDLVTNVWEQLGWSDKRVSWNPKDYGGIESVHLPSHFLWTPDLKLYNSVTAVEERDRTNAIVFSNGSIIWVPSALYRTLCNTNSAGNELDCQLKVGSWTYDADTVKLEFTGTGVNLGDYQNSTCPLAAESATATIQTKHYPCCTEPYSHVEVSLKLKKQQV